jgi:glycosyltransferase involved in cell wall biosynthesis
MNIVMLCPNDPAGVAIQFAGAVNRHTPHRCRVVTTETRYACGFAEDLHAPALGDFDEVEALLRGADVLHFHVGVAESLALGPLRVADYTRGRLLVHHHHGEPPLRNDPAAYRARHRRLGRPVLVSTPDLLRLLPDAVWIPNPVPLWDVRYLPAPRARRGDGPVRVVQCPTRRELKDTALFLDVVGGLRRAGVPLEAVLVENRPHDECLRLKRRCDIVFDHLQGYYGVSSLEGLAQGLPVIAGVDAWNRFHIRAFTGADALPWVAARGADGLARALRRLAADPVERRAVGDASRMWMETYWTEALIAERLCAFYAEAIEHGAAQPLAAGA